MAHDMSHTAEQVLEEQNAPTNPKELGDAKKKAALKKKHAEFKSRIESCKQYRRRLITNWSINIDYRRGKAFASSSDQDQIAVPLDWSMTKTKQAALFSQVPQVRVSHPPSSGQTPWLAGYEGKLNDTLVMGGIESAMDEIMPDCINAAGFGVAIVALETIQQEKEVPAVDLSILPPEVQAKALETGMIGGVEIPMEVVPQVVDRRYTIQRLSPSDFLWPLDFTGSSFDNAPWLGRSGRITWAEAVHRFGLKDEDKELVMGEDRTHLDKLTLDVDKDKIQPEDKVSFDEIFYKEHQYDPEAQSYNTIHHLVFINGKPEPVIDEPWKGQRVNEDGTVAGAQKFPIRVLTLAYITDDAIPPSDTAIGRSQVDEINKSRGQVILQRDRNIPVRWIDINRTDPSVAHGLMRGTWQNFIPVQGDGSRIIGEVAKSGHPTDNFTFDQIAKSDLAEAWTIGANQMGSGQDIETKGESQEIAAGFQTRVSRERARVASFVVGIAEVLGGIMCLYEDPQLFGEGFDPNFSKSLSFSILADSTVLLDSNQRLERLNQFMNTYAKSGFVNLEPVLKEIAILSGLDPNVAIKVPEPQAPPPPNISLRLTGAEDMMNPLNLAFMLKSNQAPDMELIKKAIELIQFAVSVPGLVQPGAPPQDPNAPAPQDGPPLEKVGEANPDMTVLPKIAKRSDDPAAGGKEGV